MLCVIVALSVDTLNRLLAIIAAGWLEDIFDLTTHGGESSLVEFAIRDLFAQIPRGTMGLRGGCEGPVLVSRRPPLAARGVKKTG